MRLVPEVIEAAQHAGWRTDDPGNVAVLPASSDARQKLQTEGIERPVHDSGRPKWNKEVTDRLFRIRKGLFDNDALPGSDAYNREARQQLEKLQDDLRQLMVKDRRLTQNAMHVPVAHV